MASWRSGNDVGHVSEVDVRPARLVLRWIYRLGMLPAAQANLTSYPQRDCKRAGQWECLQPGNRRSDAAPASLHRLYEISISGPNSQQTWRQEFLGCRSSTVERPSTRASAAGTLLRFF